MEEWVRERGARDTHKTHTHLTLDMAKTGVMRLEAMESAAATTDDMSLMG